MVDTLPEIPSHLRGKIRYFLRVVFVFLVFMVFVFVVYELSLLCCLSCLVVLSTGVGHGAVYHSCNISVGSLCFCYVCRSVV